MSKKPMKFNTVSLKFLSEADLPLLYDWFQKPHIKQWYARGEDYSLDMIKEKYLPRIQKPELIPNFIIYADSQAIGYIQFYRVSSFLPDGVEDYTHPLFSNYKPYDMAGIDMFIADDKYLGKGYASFYWGSVSPYTKDALEYLRLTEDGKQWIANMYSHVFDAEHSAG